MQNPCYILPNTSLNGKQKSKRIAFILAPEQLMQSQC